MFYHYDQNNSGGGFIVNDRVTFNVIIEADSPKEADERAQEVGIYFDDNFEVDCRCCGTRWSRAWTHDCDETPMIYGTPVEDHEKHWGEPGKPYAYVYYRDGGQVSYSRPGDAK